MSINKVIGLIASTFVLGCGQPPTTSAPKALTIDESVDGVLYSSCRDSDCQPGEISFYNQNLSEDLQKYIQIFEGDGSIVMEDSSIFLRNGEVDILIGSHSEGVITALCSGSFTDVCNLSFTKKQALDENIEPVYVAILDLLSNEVDADQDGLRVSSNTRMLSYITPSPNQENAGTCNYMANTGAMEMLLNQDFGIKNPTTNSATDLSETFLINIPNVVSYGNHAILGFNDQGVALARDLPFINSKSRPSGDAKRNAWNQDIDDVTTYIAPSVAVKSLFGGKVLDNTIWDVAVMHNTNIVDLIKREVDKGRPVLVTYNHFSIWHVVIIAGYNDTSSTSCGWVEQAISGDSMNASARKKIAKNYTGCSGQGVFYVRDSLGFDKGDRSPTYSKRSYEWLEYLGNHVFSTYLK